MKNIINFSDRFKHPQECESRIKGLEEDQPNPLAIYIVMPVTSVSHQCMNSITTADYVNIHSQCVLLTQLPPSVFPPPMKKMLQYNFLWMHFSPCRLHCSCFSLHNNICFSIIISLLILLIAQSNYRMLENFCMQSLKLECSLRLITTVI